jgi:hypothetical protein
MWRHRSTFLRALKGYTPASNRQHCSLSERPDFYRIPADKEVRHRRCIALRKRRPLLRTPLDQVHEPICRYRDTICCSKRYGDVVAYSGSKALPPEQLALERMCLLK